MRMEQMMYPLQEVWIRLEEGRVLYSGERMTSPEQAVDVMQREMSRYDREVVCIVNLNNAKQPINFNIVSVGTLGVSIVDVANVLKSSILSNAGAFIMLHNHPGGDPTPSGADLEVTKRLILAGNLMGIPCVDHIIIAGGRKEIYSMREHNDLEFTPEFDQVMKGAADMVAEQGAAYQTPFGDIDPAALAVAMADTGREKKEEVTLKFGKGLCQFFTSKKGTELARIRIPDTPFESWPSFVVPAKFVHENRYGKGYWMKLPADGKTELSISRRVTLEDGSEGWQEKRIPVDNKQLKDMVEAYKKEAPAVSSPEGPDERPKERGR